MDVYSINQFYQKPTVKAFHILMFQECCQIRSLARSSIESGTGANLPCGGYGRGSKDGGNPPHTVIPAYSRCLQVQAFAVLVCGGCGYAHFGQLFCNAVLAHALVKSAGKANLSAHLPPTGT